MRLHSWGDTLASSADALAVNGAGHVYVAGTADSSDFAGITPESDHSLGFGAFVAKLNPGLTSVFAATLLGGARGAQAFALALDGTDYVYVAGTTRSTDFPGVTSASADSNFDGTSEVFVAKLDGELGVLLAATFLGGSHGYERSSALAVDSAGNVFVAGSTASSDFPSIGPHSADVTFAVSFEGFVAKLNGELAVIQGSSFVGGSETDDVTAIALDSMGRVYVAGGTSSDDFPGAADGPGPVPLDHQTGFVARLDPNLSRDVPLPACDRQIVNNMVNLVVTQTSGPTLHLGAPAGSFRITASLSNVGNTSILQPVTLNVITLTNGNQLLSATEGGSEVGSRQAFSVGDDDALTPGESVTMNIDVGLTDRNPFQIFVDVEGCVLSAP